MLKILGLDLEDASVKETPRRFSRYMLEFAKGKPMPDNLVTTFPTESAGLVLSDRLHVKSLCGHHLAPFFGDCLIAYIPNKKIIGLSKFQRIVDYIAKQPTEQEHLTESLGKYLISILNPVSLMVIMKCTHTCMVVRGVQNPNATTTTQFTHGTFRPEELMLIKL